MYVYIVVMKQKIKQDRMRSMLIGFYDRHYKHFEKLITIDEIKSGVGSYIRSLVDEDIAKRKRRQEEYERSGTN